MLNNHLLSILCCEAFIAAEKNLAQNEWGLCVCVL